MEKYVKDAIKSLQYRDELKIVFKLKSKRDFKKNFLRLGYSKFILAIQKKLVPSHFKNWLLRTTGMNVGYDACVPHDITFDPYFPELITLGKGCLVGGLSNMVTHKVKGSKLILGKAVMKERTLIGGWCKLMPGSVVSKNSILSSGSTLDEVMPEGEIWLGKPAKQIKKLEKEEIEKYFVATQKKKGYYREFRKKVNAFVKDPIQMHFKMHYNGKRLNAGNDWWRARAFLRIWYNGIIIEITRMLPHSWFKILLLRMAGVKIGKNCYIGKGTVFDHIYCDLVRLDDDVRIEEDCYFDGHEYTITQTIFGKIHIKTGVHFKKHSAARVGTTIGENTTIEPDSFAQREIPPNEVWGGIPAKFIRKK